MGDAAKKLFDQALELPAEEREALAELIFASLSGPPEAELREELGRRIDDVRSGTAQLATWDEVRASMRDARARVVTP